MSESPVKSPNPEQKSGIVWFLSQHPAVLIIGAIGAIASLVSIPLAIYLYYAGKGHPQITYFVHPVRAIAVRAGEASRLTTTFDNEPISTDISIAQIAVWNQGTQSVRSENVLRPVVIFTENNVPILEATIRRSSREVTQLTLNTAELQKGRVTVLWNILEPNDGGVIQLIYAGPTSVPFRAEGTIEGQPQIARLEYSGQIKNPDEQYESGKSGYRSYGYGLLAVSGLLILLVFKFRRDRASYRRAVEDLWGAFNLRRETSDKTAEFYKRQLTHSNDRIAKLEARKGDDEFTNKQIADEKKAVQEATDTLKEYDKKRNLDMSEEAAWAVASQKKEKGYRLWIGGLILMAMLILIPALYFLFIAQPAGPPFGF